MSARLQPTLPQPQAASHGTPPPVHVGIIMDGNGRWAAERGLPRAEGHRRGMEAVRQAVSSATELGIGYLTIFSFSSENWTRPSEEVQLLFALLRIFIQSDLADLHEKGVKITVIGAEEGVPKDICLLLEDAERVTANNTGLRFQVAFNYGGRDEIARAVRRIAPKLMRGEVTPAEITPTMIAAHLDTAGIPDPDLIIRTSGELRLSNFLLWQAAYSELVFLPIYWPDFDRKAFGQAVDEFGRRKRRYGGLAAAGVAG
ncbi:MAG: isoprenyl transferase [Bauldia sp.]|nr:isoprenyl transferase [Bauldia sp.]MCW5718991.1 isoprenyl transferase [Bauldia sp.]